MHNNQTIMEFTFNSNITTLADSDQLSFCNMSEIDENQEKTKSNEDNNEPNGVGNRSCVPTYLDSTAAGRWLSCTSYFDPVQNESSVYLITSEHVYSPKVQQISMYIIRENTLVQNISLFSVSLSQDIMFLYTPPIDVALCHSNRTNNQSSMALLTVFKQYDHNTYFIYCYSSDCSNHTSPNLLDDGTHVLLNNFTIISLLTSSSGVTNIPMWIPAVAIVVSLACCVILIAVLVILYRKNAKRRQYQSLPSDSVKSYASGTSFKKINS
jgi:hypothetical protein